MSTKTLALFVLIVFSQCALILNLMPLNAPQPTLSGDPERGEMIFRSGVNGSPPCLTCHALVPGGFTLGPVMQGISQRAGERIAGMSAHDYLYQSITQPKAFIVSGYRDIMYPSFRQHFDEQDLADLIAFLMTQ